jgi:hypothetical protein
MTLPRSGSCPSTGLNHDCLYVWVTAFFVQKWLRSYGRFRSRLRNVPTPWHMHAMFKTRAEPRTKYYNCAPQRRTGARFDKPKLLSAVLTPIWADVG